MGMPSSACYFAEICGKGLAMEHDGSVFSCDHYVYPDYCLGTIRKHALGEMAVSPQQMRFGLDKQDRLPNYCQSCEVLFACNGECPKNRLLRTPDGEPGLNYLCRGLRRFFNHIDPWMKRMAGELQAGRTADGVMKIANASPAGKSAATVSDRRVKLNAACPCGSGLAYKKCCFRKRRQKVGAPGSERTK